MPRSYLFLVGLCMVFGVVFAEQREISVQAGDTLWNIAQRYDTTVQALREKNNLQSDGLSLGDTLQLPTDSTASPTSYTVQAGDTLYDISVAFKVPVDQLIAVNNIDGTTIKPGQVINLALAAPVPAPLVIKVQAGETLWALAREHDSSVAAIKTLNNLSSDSLSPGDTLTIPGRYAAANQADQGGASPVTIEVSKGDTLSEIASRYNTSVTALMAANELPDVFVKAGQNLRIVPGNELAMATAPALPALNIQGADMVWPLNGAITSRFGYRRLRVGGSNFHTGLDIDGETGDPIYAAVSGLVKFSGWRSGYGNLVILTSGDTDYYYAHASELLVNEGEVVGTGQVIALVGSTGRSTGSHLHFEIRTAGQSIDPLPVLEQSAKRH